MSGEAKIPENPLSLPYATPIARRTRSHLGPALAAMSLPPQQPAPPRPRFEWKKYTWETYRFFTDAANSSALKYTYESEKLHLDFHHDFLALISPEDTGLAWEAYAAVRSALAEYLPRYSFRAIIQALRTGHRPNTQEDADAWDTALKNASQSFPKQASAPRRNKGGYKQGKDKSSPPAGK